MNAQHVKTLQVPFNKAVMATMAISQLVNDQLRHAATEAEANAEAALAWASLNDILLTIGKQLGDIIGDRPCQCAKCQSERAEALAQAEQIFAGGDQ